MDDLVNFYFLCTPVTNKTLTSQVVTLLILMNNLVLSLLRDSLDRFNSLSNYENYLVTSAFQKVYGLHKHTLFLVLGNFFSKILSNPKLFLESAECFGSAVACLLRLKGYEISA